MKTNVETNTVRIQIAKRMLTIESYINGYYQCDVRETGTKKQNFINTEILGLVPITYKRLFGDIKPVPYGVYADLLSRNRTSALSWERNAQGCLEVYPNKRQIYEKFLEQNSKDILEDCGVNDRLVAGLFVRMICVVPTEKIEGKKLASYINRN